MVDCFPSGLPPVSARALSIWAKSVYMDPQDKRYLQLWQHMEDTAEIAAHVCHDFMADDVKALIAEDVGGLDVAEGLYRFLASAHDVGKASPVFVAQVPELADRVRMAGLPVKAALAKDRHRSEYRHELVGCWAMRDWLAKKGLQTGKGTLADGIAAVVAGHHGTSLTGAKEDLKGDWNARRFVGDDDWQSVRFELLDWAAQATGFQRTLEALDGRPLRNRTQILLTGMVVIADWIASDTRLCALNEPGEAGERDERSFDPRRRAARAWRMLRLPEPWHVRDTEVGPDELFAERFDIPGAHLRPVQREAVRMAQSMAKPGLLIVEANMGEGKTEAALLAAETLAARFHCGGIYYALPTQATVNAMFTRILDWIAHLPAEDRCELASVFLAHGKRELNDDYERMREQWFDGGGRLDDSMPGESVGSVDGSDSGDARAAEALQAVVNSWLTGPKRGNLSDFVVGTIDQILMAGLRCRHVVLRHLAFAGKVVILDEIHSNTAYMNVYMENVLSWLGTYGTPVIMLSATLPQDRRQAFLAAYRAGANAAAAAPIQKMALPKPGLPKPGLPKPGLPKPALPKPVAPATLPSPARQTRSLDDLDLRYPLISMATANEERDVNPQASGRSTTIQVQLLPDDDESLVALLRDKLHDGGCAVVIRNTVKRAQHAYAVLSEALDTEVSLAHARFLACDRARIDRDLLRRYGKRSDASSRIGVVVATQVVEQSLDVDFDLMVTDIAPIDLILQRSGRLHRHHRGADECDRPQPLRAAQLYVTGVEFDGEVEQTAPRFADTLECVYPRYLLMRSLAVLGIASGDMASMTVPDDIPRLVQSVYGGIPVCPAAWIDGEHGETAAFEALQNRRNGSENSALMSRIFNPQDARFSFDLDSWLASELPDPDSPGSVQRQIVNTSVRENDDDSVEVIVLQCDDDGNLQLPSWSEFADADAPLPSGVGAPDRQQTRDILSCTISLGSSALQHLSVDSVISALKEKTPKQWRVWRDQSRSLAKQLLVVLDRQGNATYEIEKDGTMRSVQFHYSAQKGWETHVER